MKDTTPCPYGCGTSLRSWRPTTYTRPQEDRSGHGDGHEHTAERCRDALIERLGETELSRRGTAHEAFAHRRAREASDRIAFGYAEERNEARVERDAAILVVDAVRAWAQAECGATEAEVVLAKLAAYDDARVR